MSKKLYFKPLHNFQIALIGKDAQEATFHNITRVSQVMNHLHKLT